MVKTIKKQKRTVAFRKTKTTALQSGKVKKSKRKTIRKKKNKKDGGGPYDCPPEYQQRIDKVLQLTHQIAVNRSIIYSNKSMLNDRYNNYLKNRDVNYENHMANLNRQREIYTEMIAIHNKNKVLAETRRDLINEIPDSVKKACNLRQRVKATNFDAKDLESVDYI
jgi:hypothetical protein